MSTKTKAKTPGGYKRVPVLDVTATDEELIGENRPQRYDWVGIGDKAVALAKKDPEKWLLVDEDGATTTASRITARQVSALNNERFLGWIFRGRCTSVKYLDENGQKLSRKRAKIWIQAIRTEVDL